MDEWMPGVRQVATAATSVRTLAPEAVVFHVIQGHRATMDEWAKQRPAVNQASYHFVIDLDGTPTQYVPISQRAWHAGRVPSQGAAAALWPAFRPDTNPNDYTVGIGAAGFSETTWNDAQHTTAIEILRWLESEWMDINDETVIGHRDLDPSSRAHDPGPNWDREWLLEHVASSEELSSLNKPLPIGPFESQLWAEAWSRGATPVRYAGDDEIHEIRITRRK
jgi:N-acetyl-anhydromuramyl-L-alanine amidase AmpD